MLSELKIPFTKQDLQNPPTPLRGGLLDKDYEILLDALEFEPQSIDTLVERTTPAEPASGVHVADPRARRKGALHAGGRYARSLSRQGMMENTVFDILV